MIKTIVPAAAVLAMLFAGCSKTEPGAPASNQAAPRPSPVATAVEQFVKVPGVTFAVSPAEFRLCESDKGRIVANVSWNVAPAGIKYVNILISRGGSEPKLFMSGKSAGEHATGSWVQDGTEFILQNATTKQKLAVQKVAGKSC